MQRISEDTSRRELTPAAALIALLSQQLQPAPPSAHSFFLLINTLLVRGRLEHNQHVCQLRTKANVAFPKPLVPRCRGELPRSGDCDRSRGGLCSTQASGLRLAEAY